MTWVLNRDNSVLLYFQQHVIFTAETFSFFYNKEIIKID